MNACGFEQVDCINKLLTRLMAVCRLGPLLTGLMGVCRCGRWPRSARLTAVGV